MNSKYYEWNKTGTRMILSTNFKEFNKQTNYISDGNVIANTQYSNIIRPYNETECNGIKFPKGHLFEHDLQFFNIDYHMKKYIEKLDQKVTLYEFYIYKKNKEKDIVGWLIEKDEKIINLVVNSYHANFNKRYSVLDTIRNILEEKKER